MQLTLTQHKSGVTLLSLSPCTNLNHTERLKGHGEGKNMRWKENLYINQRFCALSQIIAVPLRNFVFTQKEQKSFASECKVSCGNTEALKYIFFLPSHIFCPSPCAFRGSIQSQPSTSATKDMSKFSLAICHSNSLGETKYLQNTV